MVREGCFLSMVAILEKISRKSVAVDAALLSEANAHGLDATGISEAALREALRQARAAKAWAEENAEAMAEHRAWVEKNGLPLAEFAVLKID